MSQTVFTLRAESEAIELFNQLHEQMINGGTPMTKGGFFEHVVNTYSSPSKVRVVENTDTKQELDALKLQNQNLESDNQQLAQQLAELTAAYEELSNQPVPEPVEKIVEVVRDRELQANELLLLIPDWSSKLLTETCTRLSVKYKKEITPGMILLDMFNRYTIDQYNEWFYPFVIKNSELEIICGYNLKTLKDYVRG